MIKVKTTRKNKAGVFTATICIALISLTSMADGHTTTSSTCKTCKGKGVVYEECPVCHGTRYVWKCKSKRYNGYYHSESQSERTGKDFDFWGMVVFTSLYTIARISAFVLDAPNALMARFEKHLQAESKNRVQIAKVV